ncbi:uncharacterized protein [Mytilus edulis]|uniref:uncharacterized protein n=1 Tax=Mytilus edulis TaxID=6550 RepID=UPI0039EFB595
MEEIIRSDSRRNRDLLEVVIQKNEEKSGDDSRNRLPALLLTATDEMSEPPSFASKRSGDISKDRFSNNDVEDFKINQSISYIHKMINSLGILCIANLVLCGLTLQVILNITENDVGHPKNTSLLSSPKSYADLLEVTSAFASFVFALDMCSMMICCMQFFFASKILTVQNGKERAAKYLTDCSSSRFVAILGFFISVPAFLITMMCYVLMKMRTTPAITAAVILSIGVVLCGLSIFQNVYHWQDEIGRANDGLPVYEDSKIHTNNQRPKNELNTLV